MLSSGERQRVSRLLTDRTRERDRIWQVSEDLLGVSNFEGISRTLIQPGRKHWAGLKKRSRHSTLINYAIRMIWL